MREGVGRGLVKGGMRGNRKKIAHKLFLTILTDYQDVNITRQLVHNPPQNLMCVEVVNVSTIEDSLVEGNEEFTLSLSSTSFIVDVATPTANVTIVDDESEFFFGNGALSIYLTLYAQTKAYMHVNIYKAKEKGGIFKCVVHTMH